jgi:hypothetical protein
MGKRGWKESGMKLPWKQSIDPWENPFCIYRFLHFVRVGGTTIHSMEFTERPVACTL